MIQRYNDNTKMVKATRYSARDLKSLYILLENLAEGLGEDAAGVTYLSIRINQKVAASSFKGDSALLNGSRKGTVGVLVAT